MGTKGLDKRIGPSSLYALRRAGKEFHAGIRNTVLMGRHRSPDIISTRLRLPSDNPTIAPARVPGLA
jgi:hypothetical protein